MVAKLLTPHDGHMTSIHIEHPVNDFGLWLETFQSFEDFRAEGGVKAVKIRHAVDDPNYVSVDLEFDDVEQARAFLSQLEAQIWPNSPHFDGVPTSHILSTV